MRITTSLAVRRMRRKEAIAALRGKRDAPHESLKPHRLCPSQGSITSSLVDSVDWRPYRSYRPPFSLRGRYQCGWYEDSEAIRPSQRDTGVAALEG